MRSRCNVFLLYLCLLTVSIPALAQQSAAVAPQRDAAASATLQKAIAAMSGQSSLPQITSAQITGSSAPVGNSGYPAGNFTWTVALTASGYEFSNQFQSGGNTQILVSGHGSPAVSANGKVTRLLGHMSMAASQGHMPIVVLLMAMLNQGYTITQSTSAQIGNVLATHVHLSNDADQVTKAVTPQEWYFDPNSGLPLHVDFRAPDALNALSWTAGARDFSNWQSVGGFLLPFQITNSSEGTAVSVTTISSVQMNVPVTQSQFDLP
jgi:hypothetical protein